MPATCNFLCRLLDRRFLQNNCSKQRLKKKNYSTFCKSINFSEDFGTASPVLKRLLGCSKVWSTASTLSMMFQTGSKSLFNFLGYLCNMNTTRNNLKVSENFVQIFKSCSFFFFLRTWLECDGVVLEINLNHDTMAVWNLDHEVEISQHR